MKSAGSGTGEQLSLLCNWQHKLQGPTGLTFSFSSISASDSSNQRSKSGARKSGRFSCLVSLSHQLLSFFCTVMFSCLWVILHTGWRQTHQQKSKETSSETELIPKFPFSRRQGWHNCCSTNISLPPKAQKQSPVEDGSLMSSLPISQHRRASRDPSASLLRTPDLGFTPSCT